MNIFQTVKENVTARQAAEQYGLKVNRNGMVCCPFHKDRHPSMKVEKGFYCFACGAKGDVIAFVSDFFHLMPLEAAKKLAEDFQISIQDSGTQKIRKRKKKRTPTSRSLHDTERKMEQWEQESIRILSEYLRLLEEWKREYAPKGPEGLWNEKFMEACRQKEKTEYYLDILLEGDLRDRIDTLLDKGKEVEELEKRLG